MIPRASIIAAVTLVVGALGLNAANLQSAIDLTNYDSNQPIFFWDGRSSPVRAPVMGTFVQVLGGKERDALVVLTSLGRESTFALTEPGFFDAGFGEVP